MGKESDLYDPLNTKTIGGELRLDVDTYENVQDNIHIENVNRKLLELTDLVGRVTNNRSDSGPIPGTGTVATATATQSSVDYTVKTPAKGEVWQVVGIGATANATLGSLSGITLYVKIDDGTNEATIIEWSGSGSIEPADTSFNNPIFFDENLSLVVRIYKSGGISGGEEVEFQIPIIRVR
jgi:hypothetical protein